MPRLCAVVVLLAVACRPTPQPVAATPTAAPAPPPPAPPTHASPSPPEPQPEAGVTIELGRAPPHFAPGARAPSGLDAHGIREFARDQGDPLGGVFDLGAAFIGDAALGSRRGKLFAILRTDVGAIECELFEQEAPLTVANFVGLARGVRPFRDADSGAWITGRFYDGTIFHRVLAGFMIQGGDRAGTGEGDIGYVIADEIAPDFTFEVPGMLAMANRGRNTGSSQFFVTVAAAPHLTGTHVIFGRCDPKVPIAISREPVDASRNHRPKKDVLVRRVDFERR